jgi:REP element-mobilizing transposase RayT
MANTIGYMVTWTTYGTWLQGDKRKYVKDGKILPADKELAETNRRNLKKEPVQLNNLQKQIIENAIREEAVRFGQQIYALKVCAKHIHLVVKYIPKPVELMVQHYKSIAFMALRKTGITGQIWTKGFNTRYCFDENMLQTKIKYVNNHPDNI